MVLGQGIEDNTCTSGSRGRDMRNFRCLRHLDMGSRKDMIIDDATDNSFKRWLTLRIAVANLRILVKMLFYLLLLYMNNLIAIFELY